MIIDVRIIIFQYSKSPNPTLTPTPVFKIPFPIFTFVPTTEGRKILPKLLAYYRTKKIRPWYVQVQVELKMVFTHLSKRDKFYYIHNKLKPNYKITIEKFNLNQIQKKNNFWSKTRPKTGVFSRKFGTKIRWISGKNQRTTIYIININ